MWIMMTLEYGMVSDNSMTYFVEAKGRQGIECAEV